MNIITEEKKFVGLNKWRGRVLDESTWKEDKSVTIPFILMSFLFLRPSKSFCNFLKAFFYLELSPLLSGGA
jgi:hypothetical protein